jgi:hypothetical protein
MRKIRVGSGGLLEKEVENNFDRGDNKKIEPSP